MGLRVCERNREAERCEIQVRCLAFACQSNEGVGDCWRVHPLRYSEGTEGSGPRPRDRHTLSHLGLHILSFLGRLIHSWKPVCVSMCVRVQGGGKQVVRQQPGWGRLNSTAPIRSRCGFMRS